MKFFKIIFLFVLFSFLVPAAPQAHKLRVFAFVEGDYIVGESSFSGGRKAKNVEIAVSAAAGGKTLLTCRTDDQGSFRVQIPREARDNRLDLLIVANGGDGHRGEWPLPAAEYLGPGGAAPEMEPAVKADMVAPAEGRPESGGRRSEYVDDERLRRIVEDVLEEKLAPLKYMLAKGREQGPSLSDIIGGIGYILGLAGIAAYFKSKKMR